MITINNHNEKISSIDLSTAPDALINGKAFFAKASSLYGKNEGISNTIDIYISKLNEFASKNQENKIEVDTKVAVPEKVKKIAKKAKKTINKQTIIDQSDNKTASKPEKIKPKSKMVKTTKYPNRPKKNPRPKVKVKFVKVKQELKKASVTKKVKSLELQLLQRYAHLDGKTLLYPMVVKFHKALSTALNEKLITEHVTLIKDIMESFTTVIAKMKETKSNELKINCKADTLAKAKGILIAPVVKLRVEYLGNADNGANLGK